MIDNKVDNQNWKKELGCSFIRVTDKKSNEYNVGLVLKNIITTYK